MCDCRITSWFGCVVFSQIIANSKKTISNFDWSTRLFHVLLYLSQSDYVLATKHIMSRVVSDSVPYKRTFKFQGNVIERGNVKKETLTRVDCTRFFLQSFRDSIMSN